MRKLIIGLLVSINIFSCLGQTENACQCKEEFYQVLTDLENIANEEYFVSINARYKDDVFKIIISNYELSELFSDSKGSLDLVYMISVLKGKVVTLDEETLHRVSIVREWNHLKDIFYQGKDYTVKTFFNAIQQSKYLSDSESNFLIDRLFNWCYLIYQDDETGKLIILTADQHLNGGELQFKKKD